MSETRMAELLAEVTSRGGNVQQLCSLTKEELLPALKVLNLEGSTAASQQARDAVQAALAARSH